MLVATITLLDAAFVRWPITPAWWDLRVAQMCCYPLLPRLTAYDVWSAGKAHRATLWASVLLIDRAASANADRANLPVAGLGRVRGESRPLSPVTDNRHRFHRVSGPLAMGDADHGSPKRASTCPDFSD